MPHSTSKYFGTVSYEDSSVLHFPEGLPGFEGERRFLALEHPEQKPLVFLQSLTTPSLCFLALPASAIDPAYELEMDEADLELLGIESAAGKDLLTLALVTIAETGITANLLAPVVIDTKKLLGVQAVSPAQRYSHLHPLCEAWEPVCS